MNTKHREIHGMFDGPILPLTARIALPVLAGQTLNYLYILVDTFFVSRIDTGSTALLSGTGLVFPVFFITMAAGISISVGASSYVARMIGERNERVYRKIIPSALALTQSLSLLVVLGGYLFGGAIIRGLAGARLSPDALLAGQRYFYFLVPGMALIMIGQAFMGTLQGEGKTGVIARAMVISTVVNVALDPILIFWAGMGVAGAGLATSVAVCCASFYIVVVFLKGKTIIEFSYRPSLVSLSVIKEIIRIGFPHSISMSALSLSFMFLNKLVGSIGEAAMNSWVLAGRLNEIVLLPSFAVGTATVSMVGQNFGRGLLDRVKKVYLTNALTAAVTVGCIAVLYMIFAPVLFGYISDVQEVIHLAVMQVRCLALTYVGVAFAIVTVSSLQALGKPFPALFISIIRIGIIAIPLAYLLVRVYEMGMMGLYRALGISNLFAMPIAVVVAYLILSKLTVRSSSLPV